MKVMLLTRKLDRGGAQRQFVALARGLKQKGLDVVIAVFYGGGLLEDELRMAGVRIISLEKKGRWDLLGFALRCVWLVRKERPEILYSFLGVPNIISALLSPFVSSMRVVWGVRASNMDLRQYDLLSRLSYRVECMLSRVADVVICNSDAGRKYAVSHGFPERKTIYIPNGIDTVAFKPDREAGMRIRRELGVHAHEVLVGMVARCDPMKDHVTFLQALTLATAEMPDIRGVCVGGGKDRYCQEARAHACRLGLEGRVLWMGERHDMQAIYNALNVLCLASASEGFPNVIGEAMACGVPCLVTDVGDSAFIVGESGCVVPPHDPVALRDAMVKMTTKDMNDLREIGTRARERVISKYALDAMVESTLQVITAI